jgi:hypothetical protein
MRRRNGRGLFTGNRGRRGNAAQVEQLNLRNVFFEQRPNNLEIPALVPRRDNPRRTVSIRRPNDLRFFAPATATKRLFKEQGLDDKKAVLKRHHYSEESQTEDNTSETTLGLQNRIGMLRLQRGTNRAMSSVRLGFSRLLFKEYLNFDENILTIRYDLICTAELTFQRLLESCAACLGDVYLIEKVKSLTFRFFIQDKAIDFLIKKDGRPAINGEQIVIGSKPKAYKDFNIFKKTTTDSIAIDPIIADLMLQLLEAPINQIPEALEHIAKQLGDIDGQLCIEEILEFLLITHVAESYRRASLGSLKQGDLDKATRKKLKKSNVDNYDPTSEEESNPHYSRTPGMGKLTRSFLRNVINGLANLTLEDFNRYIAFSNRRGANIQRLQALNLSSDHATSGQRQIMINMSESSAPRVINSINGFHLSMPDGLERQKVPGDGHCLYHAVGLHLGQDQQTLRSLVADYLSANRNRFQGFTSVENYDGYIQRIRDGQEWAGHLEIEVLMCLLNRPIVIIDQAGVIRIPREVLERAGDPIFVYYNGYTHYDALTVTEGHNARQIMNEILRDQAFLQADQVMEPDQIKELEQVVESETEFEAESEQLNRRRRASL